MAATLALAVAGCGSSSKSLSKADLDAKVNAICKTENAQQAKIKVPPDFTTNPTAAATYLTALDNNVGSTVSQLKGLKADSSVKSQYDAYIADVEHAQSLLKTALAKAKAKDRTGLQTVQQLGNYLTNTVHPAEKALGFTTCAGNG